MAAQRQAPAVLPARRRQRVGLGGLLAARKANVIALVLLSLGTCISAATLVNEQSVQRTVATARFAGTGLSPSDRAYARSGLAGCEASRDERVLLACVSGWASLARAEPEGSPGRAADLARGRVAAAAFDVRVPTTGDTLASTVFLESVDAGGEGKAVAALRESYARQPYSRDSGLWRLWYASRHWELLDPATRRAMLVEAVWYGSIGKADRDAVVATLLGTPPFVSVDLRLPGYPGEGLALPTTP